MSRSKVAIVTGGTQGIGLAITKRFLAEGFSVMTCSNSATTGRAAIDRLRSETSSDRVEFQEVELADPTQIEQMVAKTVAHWGPPAAIVNNGAACIYRDTAEVTVADIQHTLNVNVIGYWRLATLAYALMKQEGGGAIVNIASTQPLRATRKCFPYNASKGAVLAMTKAMAIDFAPAGVRANAVLPGFVRTEQSEERLNTFDDPDAKWAEVLAAHPAGRVPTAEDVASAVWFLVSDDASGISGIDLIVDCGRNAMQT